MLCALHCATIGHHQVVSTRRRRKKTAGKCAQYQPPVSNEASHFVKCVLLCSMEEKAIMMCFFLFSLALPIRSSTHSYGLLLPAYAPHKSTNEWKRNIQRNNNDFVCELAHAQCDHRGERLGLGWIESQRWMEQSNEISFPNVHQRRWLTDYVLCYVFDRSNMQNNTEPAVGVSTHRLCANWFFINFSPPPLVPSTFIAGTVFFFHQSAHTLLHDVCSSLCWSGWPSERARSRNTMSRHLHLISKVTKWKMPNLSFIHHGQLNMSIVCTKHWLRRCQNCNIVESTDYTICVMFKSFYFALDIFLIGA